MPRPRKWMTGRIAGIDFGFYRIPRKSKILSFGEDVGSTDHDAQKIYTANDLPKQTERSTCLHEILHELFPDSGEGEILRMERELFTFLTDDRNRKLIGFITGETNGR